MAGVALVVDVDGLLLSATAEAGLPQAAGNAAEGDEEDQHGTDNGADDDAGNGTAAEAAAAVTAACTSTNGTISCFRGLARFRGSAGDTVGSRLGACGNATAHNGGGDAVGCRVLRGCLAVLGDDNGGGLIVPWLGRALALVGTGLPSGAADISASFLLVVFGNAVDALGGLGSGLPVGHERAGVGMGLGPGGGANGAPASSSSSSPSHACCHACLCLTHFAAAAADLAVGAAVCFAVAR